MAGRALSEGRGLSSVDIGSVGCGRAHGGSHGGSNGNRGQRGDDSGGRETHAEDLGEESLKFHEAEEREKRKVSVGIDKVLVVVTAHYQCYPLCGTGMQALTWESRNCNHHHYVLLQPCLSDSLATAWLQLD